MNVVVTGANGFVGIGLTRALTDRAGFSVVAAVRSRSAAVPEGVRRVLIMERESWDEALGHADAVVHLAGRAHRRSSGAEALDEYRRDNVEFAQDVAVRAAAAGVKHFVFASTVKVHGHTGKFIESDTPSPSDPYGQSKYTAEQKLQRISAETGMALTIIRPPLVYGPGVKGNFRTLLRLVELRVPLPLGRADNRRSLVALDNLVDFMVTCLEDPRARGEIFFVSDDADLSTAELIRRIGDASDIRTRLLPVPPRLVRGAAAMVGKGAVADRLFGSLCVDVRKARERLGWSPAVSIDRALTRLVLAERQPHGV